MAHYLCLNKINFCLSSHLFYLTAKADSPEKLELVDTKPTENIDKSKPTSAESELNANETDANDQASLEAKEKAVEEGEPEVQSKTIVLEAFEFLTIRDSVIIINVRSHDKTAQ